MNHETENRFESEPWYVGVFKPEPGEPRGLRSGTQLAATNALARRVIDACAEKGIEFGLHDGNVDAAQWRTDAGLQNKLRAVDAAHAQGIRNLTIDFFGVRDAFSDHHRVARFFRHIRDRMSYSECHLGIAVYGPQFQREVLINHPTDLEDFDISRFSSDWATLTGFRHSRREWQEKYQYLMPENGLFYFCTHYSNYPRRYQEPEPQRFLYIADAWRGLAYAFHDKIGFRDSLAAQSAFSTFYVFGFLDSRMSQDDLDFAREYLEWVKANSDTLNRSRVCFENDEALVMSKVRNDRGLIFAVNYTPGAKQFRMKLDFPTAKEIDVRQIYPSRGKPARVATGREMKADVPGERLAIFEVNGGLVSLPPENPSAFPVDVTGWKRISDGFQASFFMPDVRGMLARQKDDSLPRQLVSVDQTETEIVTREKGGKSMGKLPREFLDPYGFSEDKFLPTWKAAPWAFADSVRLVYLPAVAPTVTEPAPQLRINGHTIPMTPRVRYTPRTRLENPAQWDAPLWFADVTEACRYGRENEIAIVEIKSTPVACYVGGSSEKKWPATKSN